MLGHLVSCHYALIGDGETRVAGHTSWLRRMLNVLFGRH